MYNLQDEYKSSKITTVPNLIANKQIKITLLFSVIFLTHAEHALAYNMPSYNDVWPTPPLVIIGILTASLITLGIYLYRYKKMLGTKERTLNALYIKQNQEAIERKNKLFNINYRLHEEIAKHEITEELLRETQDYLQSIINSMPSILIGVSRDGKITHWNKAAQQETNVPAGDALGESLFNILNIGDITLPLIEVAIDTNEPQRQEGIQDGHGSNARYRDVSIYPLHTLDNNSVVIRIDDITTRTHLENMLIQNEKMGSLGELAAGIAHEINNPLSTILQSIQNTQRRLSSSLPENITTATTLGTDLQTVNHYLEKRKISGFLSNIKEAGERAAKIVENMLEFSRTHSSRHDTIHLADLLDRSIDLFMSSTPALRQNSQNNISIVRDFSDQPALIRGSATEIQQVLLNLLSNAHHASEGNEENTRPLEINVSLHFSDSHAVIVLADNGMGMDQWTLRHVFDPFFTTKEIGKGTGLGLSVSYFIIVEHHKGSIDVESEVNQGTTFTIRLPITSQ